MKREEEEEIWSESNLNESNLIEKREKNGHGTVFLTVLHHCCDFLD